MLASTGRVRARADTQEGDDLCPWSAETHAAVASCLMKKGEAPAKHQMRASGGNSRSIVSGQLCSRGLLHALYDLKRATAFRLLGDLPEARFPNFLDHSVLEHLSSRRVLDIEP